MIDLGNIRAIRQRPFRLTMSGQGGGGGFGGPRWTPEIVRARMQEHLDELYKGVLQNNKKADIALLRRASDIMLDFHGADLLIEDKPKAFNSILIAKRLLSWRASDHAIAASLLLDVPEKTVRSTIGNVRIGNLIRRLNNLEKINPNNSKDQAQARNCFRMRIAREPDINLHLLSAAKVYEKVLSGIPLSESELEDARNITSPLLKTLGFYDDGRKLKKQVFKILEPEKFAESQIRLLKGIAKTEFYSEEELDRFGHKLNDAIIAALGLTPSIDPLTKKEIAPMRYKVRIKDEDRIAEKLKSKDDIFDIQGVRLIMNTSSKEDGEKKCNSACVEIRSYMERLAWQEVADRFRDRIKTAKSNKYQSLQLTFVNNEGDYLEIQIRTEEMHKVAEYGPASQLLYEIKHLPKIDLSASGAPGKLGAFRRWIKQQRFTYILDQNGQVYELRAKAKGLEPTAFDAAVAMNYDHALLFKSAFSIRNKAKLSPKDSVRTGDILRIEYDESLSEEFAANAGNPFALTLLSHAKTLLAHTNTFLGRFLKQEVAAAQKSPIEIGHEDSMVLVGQNLLEEARQPFNSAKIQKLADIMRNEWNEDTIPMMVYLPLENIAQKMGLLTKEQLLKEIAFTGLEVAEQVQRESENNYFAIAYNKSELAEDKNARDCKNISIWLLSPDRPGIQQEMTSLLASLGIDIKSIEIASVPDEDTVVYCCTLSTKEANTFRTFLGRLPSIYEGISEEAAVFEKMKLDIRFELEGDRIGIAAEVFEALFSVSAQVHKGMIGRHRSCYFEISLPAPAGRQRTMFDDDVRVKMLEDLKTRLNWIPEVNNVSIREIPDGSS